MRLNHLKFGNATPLQYVPVEVPPDLAKDPIQSLYTRFSLEGKVDAKIMEIAQSAGPVEAKIVNTLHHGDYLIVNGPSENTLDVYNQVMETPLPGKQKPATQIYEQLNERALKEEALFQKGYFTDGTPPLELKYSLLKDGHPDQPELSFSPVTIDSLSTLFSKLKNYQKPAEKKPKRAGGILA